MFMPSPLDIKLQYMGKRETTYFIKIDTKSLRRKEKKHGEQIIWGLKAYPVAWTSWRPRDKNCNILKKKNFLSVIFSKSIEAYYKD